MSELCGVQISPGRYGEDPEPPEWCEAEVEFEGDCCPAHEGDDEPDWDTIRKDKILEERYEL